MTTKEILNMINSSTSIDNVNGRTLQEIGDILGVTRERVRQIEKDALEKLENAFGDDMKSVLEDYNSLYHNDVIRRFGIRK